LEILELKTKLAKKDERIASLDVFFDARGGEVTDLRKILNTKDEKIAKLEKEVNIIKAGNIALSRLAVELETKLADGDGALKGLIDRINTMALAHGKLQTSDLGKMSMWMYATSIVSQYEFAEKGVRVNVDIPMDLALPAEIAIPCGWIINELVSNCFEHAFPDGVTTGEPPEVKVEMGPENTLYGCQGRRLGVVAKDNCAVPMKLVVSDNGIGLPEDFNSFKAESMGMKIVRFLVEQIHGTMAIFRSSYGMKTKFMIRF
jgi:two-component sensor histidine kinase